MEIWIPITIAAAFLQNIRSGLQKHLTSRMSTLSATFVRFGFGAPFALVMVLLLHDRAGYPWPVPGRMFLIWVVAGGAAQIAATFLLLRLFAFRNFAVGTAYSRTEPAMAAVLAWLLLGETASWPVLGAIAICVAGVMALSVARTPFTAAALAGSVLQGPSLTGLASGALFGLAAVAYRAASLSLGGPNFLMQAAVTLACVITLQALVLAAWIALSQPGEIARIARAWRPALLVGVAGSTASLGWFTAMTLQQAAVVKALAQVEMLFAIATSALLFRERINRTEILGCALIVAGIITIALWH